MAGHKETVLQANPVAFWSFDLDKEGLNNSVIIDEVNNTTPLTAQGANYKLEQLSLNGNETAGNYACTIARDGAVNDNYINTYFEGIHNSSFDFFNNGSFSVEFFYHKKTPGYIRRHILIDGSVTPNVYDNGPGYQHNLIHPIISKPNVFNFQISDNYYSVNEINVLIADQTFTINDSVTVKMLDQTNHVVLSYDVEQTDVNQYRQTYKVYINGRIEAFLQQNIVDFLPSTTSNTNIFIGSYNGTNNSVLEGFNTELMTIDQVAIYNFGLSDLDVSRHYKKTKSYHDIVIDSKPIIYFRFNEPTSELSNNLTPDVNTTGTTGELFGSYTRGEVGPDKIITSKGTSFINDGSAIIRKQTSGYFSPIVPTGGDYTVEFWFKLDSADQGVLISSTSLTNDWDGLTLWANTKDNRASLGNIQFSENVGSYINSIDIDQDTGARINWNDNEWHYCLVKRTGNSVQFTLDGIIQGYINSFPVAPTAPSQLYIMASAPGLTDINGAIADLAIYNMSLQSVQLYTRWLYTTRYKIEGHTLLQGAPVIATVRIYDHGSGELIDTVKSDIDGFYQTYLPTQRYVDVLSFIPDNNTTRYRIHAPVRPAEFDDSHLIP